MTLKILSYKLSISKLNKLSDLPKSLDFFFLCKTDDELSLVCPAENVPEKTIARDDGWRGFQIEGVLDFGLVGILSAISTILADNGIGIFAVSTYNTDYILVKETNLDKAVKVLMEAGYEVKE